MGVQVTKTAIVTTAGSATDTLSQYVTVTGTSNPAYLVVDALDRNEYTVTDNTDTGNFSGDGATLDLSSIGGDGRGAGIVFSWQASSDQYVNATYGAFNQLDFNSSDSVNDVTNVSLFTTSNASLADACAGNAYALIQEDPSGYDGSITFANDPNFNFTPPGQATPDSIAAAALSFVGDAWNDSGCWILASTIAAEAGAGLPVQSSLLHVPGKANGEWTVLYNGPAGAGANWEGLVSTGDIVAFSGPGGGHITTCVSGKGVTAMLVDNITYENGLGQIANAANDGSSKDILVSSPHPAIQEWAGVSGSNVVIYALDTPVMTDLVASASVNVGGTLSLTSVFSAKDPAGKSITQYQVYNTTSGDSILLNGHIQTNVGSANPVIANSLSAVSFLAGGSATTDTLEIRAFNGTYLGDWQSLTVKVVVPVPRAPVLAAQTANQSWHQGQVINFVLSAGVFKDPQGQALNYTATTAGGAALPSWLSLNPASRAFTGTVAVGPASFVVDVTATDTAGLATTEAFAVNIPALAPVVAIKTPAQNVATGSTVAINLASGTFTDPQGEAMTCKATLASGGALPSWLSFNPNTLSFSGTAPTTAQTLQLMVRATDSSNLSVADSFTATIVKSTGQILVAGDWQGGALTEITPSLAGGIAEQGAAWVLAQDPAEIFGFVAIQHW